MPPSPPLLEDPFSSMFRSLKKYQQNQHFYNHFYSKADSHLPEKRHQSRLTSKSDVYSFGVVLLELLTGCRAVDDSKIVVEQHLVDWALPYLSDKRKLFRIMDTKLEGQYPQKGAFAAATLAFKCLNAELKSMPQMSEVVASLEELQSSKTAFKNSPSHAQTGYDSICKSPINRHRSPRNLTPSASPLRSHRQSPIRRG
ncbi:Protein kinase domain-containing protein [Heracleum sosnowskyi]|uniref:Protein kinase domain-containing protein n=1 Tax=Heracleum sosnowskyi TaxID=360622 RepID=A0AAD8JGK1_9APIA|nr:Protein kinase domain-containing protein [Heracleum sosnowskyi]